jgi:hypothetical protein
MDAYTTIKIFKSDKEILERFKLRIIGQILRNVSQGEALRVLVKVAEKHPDEVEELAKEILGQ